MPQCRSTFKLTATAILLATVLCSFLIYPRGKSPISGNQLTNSTFFSRMMSVSNQIQPHHSIPSSSGANSADVATSALSQLGTKYTRLPSKTNPTLPTLTNRSIQDVSTFVFFIGYPRSGHSIIASMIDAHPNAILAHEYNLFKKLAVEWSSGDKRLLLNKPNLFNALYQDSYTEAVEGWRSGKSGYERKGYSLRLNASDSWQGKFKILKVIGDKAGGSTSRTYRDNPHLFPLIYRSLVNTVHVPVRVVHVVRNPFDMIATRLLYQLSNEKGHKAEFNSTHRLKDEAKIHQAFQGLYSEIKAVHEMIDVCKLTVLKMHYVDLIQDPKKEMRSVCKFLGLSCSESYLEMCEGVTYKHVSKTREAVDWSKKMKRLVETHILQFPDFQRYSFTD